MTCPAEPTAAAIRTRNSTSSSSPCPAASTSSSTTDSATQTQHLNRSYYGLYIPPMIWRELENFSSGSVCLVLASDLFDEADYYRDYQDSLRMRAAA